MIPHNTISSKDKSKSSVKRSLGSPQSHDLDHPVNPEGIASLRPGLEQPWFFRMSNLQPLKGCASNLNPKLALTN